MKFVTVQTDGERIVHDRLNKLQTILSGDTTIGLHLQFLIRTNKVDLQILKNTKVIRYLQTSVSSCHMRLY